jgi:hypothetical protein
LAYLGNIGRPLLAAAIMAAMMALLSMLVTLAPPGQLAVSAGVGVLVYALVSRGLLPGEWALLGQWLGRRRGSGHGV